MNTLYSIYGETHPGHVRPRNEDSFDYLLTDGGRTALAVLADGVGGHNGGEVASRLTVEAALPAFAGALAAQGSMGQAWREALAEANTKVRERRLARESLARMATTVVACSAQGDRLAVAHLGDSRAYRYRNHELTQLTRDHTVAEDMADQGVEVSEALSSAYQNVITRGVGLVEDIDLAVHEDEVQPGDIYLLCSDGLSSYVTNERLRACLQAGTAQAMVRALIESALEAGGRDNVTAILIIRHAQEEP